MTLKYNWKCILKKCTKIFNPNTYIATEWGGAAACCLWKACNASMWLPNSFLAYETFLVPSRSTALFFSLCMKNKQSHTVCLYLWSAIKIHHVNILARITPQQEKSSCSQLCSLLLIVFYATKPLQRNPNSKTNMLDLYVNSSILYRVIWWNIN